MNRTVNHLHVVFVLFAGMGGVHVDVFGGEDVLELHDLAVTHSLPVLPCLFGQVVLVLRFRRHLKWEVKHCRKQTDRSWSHNSEKQLQQLLEPFPSNLKALHVDAAAAAGDGFFLACEDLGVDGWERSTDHSPPARFFFCVCVCVCECVCVCLTWRSAGAL